jgi:O-antigen/teichoic acid export membrane protein
MTESISTYKKKIEELFKHSLVYGITSSLQNVLGFIMLPILTTFYTPDVFGVYSILLLLSALTSAIFYLGASSALGRFYFDEDSDSYKKKIVTTSLLITLGGAAFLVLSGFLFANRLSLYLFQTTAYSKSIVLILIGTAFTFLLNFMTLLLRYEKKSIKFFFIIISGVILNFSITYLLLSRYKYGLLAPIYGLLISNAICFSVILLTRMHLLTRSLELNHFKMVLSFGIQSSLAGFLFYFLEWVDRLIIKDLLTLKDVGIYSLGYRLGSVMNILVIMPFTLVWGPLRMQNAKNKDADIFSGKVVSYYTIVGVMILVTTILFGEDVVKLIFANKSYSAAAIVMPIIMFSLFFYGYQSIVDFGIYLHKKVYFYILVSFIAIIFNVGMNYWLIPNFGYMAAAYITLATYMITSTSIYFISNFYLKIKVEVVRVVMALSVVPFLYFIINFLSISSILLKSIIALILFYLFYIAWLNESERRYLNQKINLLIGKHSKSKIDA